LSAFLTKERIAFLNVLVSYSYLSSTLHTNLNILFRNEDNISSLVLISSSMLSKYHLKKTKKPKHPHNLAASVEANRAAERKH
jgi:hypothetical protein